MFIADDVQQFCQQVGQSTIEALTKGAGAIEAGLVFSIVNPDAHTEEDETITVFYLWSGKRSGKKFLDEMIEYLRIIRTQKENGGEE